MALRFRDSEALRVVVASGLAAAAHAEAARVVRGADGSIVLAPERPLPGPELRRLRAIGVAVDAELAGEAEPVRCWAEAIALERIAQPAVPPVVVFVVERAAQLLELAAELVRLGCDRQELLVAGETGAIRAVDPPTYTAMRALDREAGLRGFAPAGEARTDDDPARREAVWVELGHRHPLAARLRAAPGTLLLVGADRWRTLPEDGWRGLDAALALTVPGERTTLVPAALPARRAIELRLSPGRRAAPSLWLVRRGAVAAIDRLLAYLPESVVARLAFAITAGDDPIAIIRARGGRQAPPELAIESVAGLEAEAYAPLADMPDVYSPAGAVVEPPLRRERLRAILGATGADVVWLVALPDRRFRLEQIADSAFRPLAEWPEYVLHASAPALVPWLRATELAFAPLVSTGLEWASGPPDPRAASPAAAVSHGRAGAAARTRDPAAGVPEAVLPATDESMPHASVPVAAVDLEADIATGPIAAVAVDAELARLEAEFVALDAPGDAPERIALLDRLAVAYARLGRRRDAGLCFARAVWEAPASETMARLDAWIAADGGLGRAHGPGSPREAPALLALLGKTAPSPDDVRVVAAIAARQRVGDPHRVQRWLDDHDHALDARTLWLARLGLARLAGGDQLGLAHARDRILARLAGGPAFEHELPAFLQFAGRSGALGSASGEHLAGALEDLVQRIARTRRKRSLNEAPAQLTGAYSDLQLAHGFARVGKQARARELAGRGAAVLAPVAADPVHGYLAAAFAARIEQALAGLPAETRLPEALGARLAALDRLARFKVDRLRDASRILEPLVRLDAFGGYIQGHGDPRGPELAALRAIAEPRARALALGQLIDAAARGAGDGEAADADRERLLDGILDVLLEQPEAEAVPLFIRAWPLIARLPEPRRALRYARALVVAGHFSLTELVGELLERLGDAIRVVAGADLERVLHHGVRALRRIGLRVEIAELLAGAEHALPATGPEALHSRLALAAGMAFLGDARALPIFDQARRALGANLLLATRLDLTRALALAYAQAPLRHALGGIAELSGQLRDITDSLNTNSHYCLSVLHFVESLVLGITSDDLALGEAGRRIIEDDEHLIRRRMHRDLGGLRDR